jgi:RNA polymerase sigma factor (sigma-70 family)
VIAQNVVRNRLAAKKRGNRAFPVTDYVPRAGAAGFRRQELESKSEQEEFDALLADDESESAVSRLRVEEILSLVGEGPRRVLRLAFVEGLRGKALAARLGIKEGSANVALNRAKAQLRETYHEARGRGPA